MVASLESHGKVLFNQKEKPSLLFLWTMKLRLKHRSMQHLTFRFFWGAGSQCPDTDSDIVSTELITHNIEFSMFSTNSRSTYLFALMQLTEKEKQLQEERRKLMEKKKLEEQEKARIRAQVHTWEVFLQLAKTQVIYLFRNYMHEKSDGKKYCIYAYSHA